MPPVSSALVGSAASLTCALTWAIASLVFGRVLQREPTTALALSFVKALVAAPLLFIAATATGLLSETLEPRWLSQVFLTSLLGLVIADAAYLASLKRLGVERGVLLIPLVPSSTAVMAFFALDERLSLSALVGVSLTLVGVVGAVYRPRSSGQPGGLAPWATILIAGAYVFAQAGSNVLQKDVLDGHVALYVAALRLVLGMPLMALVVLTTSPGGGIAAVRAVLRPGVRGPVIAAAAIGTALGMWLGATGTQRLPVALATTLAATTPVWALIIARLRGEAISVRAAIGAVLAVAGVAVIAASR